MSRSASARLALCGTFLLFCSTCQAQNWYSTSAPSPQTPAIPTAAAPRFDPRMSPPTSYDAPQAPYRVPAGVPSQPYQAQSAVPQPTNFGAVTGSQPSVSGPSYPQTQWPSYPQMASAAAGTSQGLAGSYDLSADNGQLENGPAYGGPACGPCGAGGPCGTDQIGNFACSGQVSKGTGFFFRYDRLYLSISAPDGKDIGSPAVEGIYTSNGIDYPFRNSLDSGFINDDFEFAGDRIEFGFLDGGGNDNCGHCGSGWIASIISMDQDHAASQSGVMILFDDPWGMLLGFQDGNGDGYDDDLNGDMIYGRDGQDIGTPDGAGGYLPQLDGIPDVPAPQDNGDLITWEPIYANVDVYSRTEASGLALSRFHTPKQYADCGTGGACLRFLWGVRYLDIDERFSLVGESSFFDETRINANAHNFIIGPEIGMCLGKARGPWSFGGELRFVPGVNIYSANQTGVIGTNAEQFAGQNRANRPLNLVPTAFTNRDEDEGFSAIVEWRAEVGYAITQWFSLRAGYTGIFVSDVARGSDINYSLPDFGISSDRSDVYINALTLGGELVY